MKKVLIFSLSFVFALSLVSCGGLSTEEKARATGVNQILVNEVIEILRDKDAVFASSSSVESYEGDYECDFGKVSWEEECEWSDSPWSGSCTGTDTFKDCRLSDGGDLCGPQAIIDIEIDGAVSFNSNWEECVIGIGCECINIEFEMKTPSPLEITLHSPSKTSFTCHIDLKLTPTELEFWVYDGDIRENMEGTICGMDIKDTMDEEELCEILKTN